jgi:uncharacterized membrane protein
MKISDYTIVISSIVIIIGWFVNSFFNRRHEISKRRMNYRLEMLHSFLPVYLSITSSKAPFLDDQQLNAKIINARILFQLYGHRDEIKLFNDFVEAIEKKIVT